MYVTERALFPQNLYDWIGSPVFSNPGAIGRPATGSFAVAAADLATQTHERTRIDKSVFMGAILDGRRTGIVPVADDARGRSRDAGRNRAGLP